MTSKRIYVPVQRTTLEANPGESRVWLDAWDDLEEQVTSRHELTPAIARELARQLLDAADVIDSQA